MKHSIALISVIILLLPHVTLAQTADVSSDYQADFGDPGITPDSPFYFFKTFGENIQLTITTDPEAKAKLASDIAQTKFAEMDAMIQKGDLDAAAVAADNADDKLQVFNDNLDQIPADKVDTVVSLESKAAVTTELSDKVSNEISNKIDNGELPDGTAQFIDLNGVKDSVVEAQSLVDDKKDDAIDTVADSQGISLTEAKLQIENKETDAGVADLKNTQAERKLVDDAVTLDNLKAQHDQAVQDGTATNDPAFDNLAANAQLRLDIAENALDNGDSAKALNQLGEVENNQITADNVLNNNDDTDKSNAQNQLEQQFSDAKQVADNLNTEIQQTDAPFIQDFQANKDQILANHPDVADDIQAKTDTAQNEVQVTQKIAGDVAQAVDNLNAQGTTGDDAAASLKDVFNKDVNQNENVINPGSTIETPAAPVSEIQSPQEQNPQPTTGGETPPSSGTQTTGTEQPSGGAGIQTSPGEQQPEATTTTGGESATSTPSGGEQTAQTSGEQPSATSGGATTTSVGGTSAGPTSGGAGTTQTSPSEQTSSGETGTSTTGGETSTTTNPATTATPITTGGESPSAAPSSSGTLGGGESSSGSSGAPSSGGPSGSESGGGSSGSG